ncbi:MAG TPA: dihydropteroate synthase, partial [Candidatus Saccharimonadales bacterium]|nr:dihydropteroate synthase [Candidatus Saccharimonadales bacterium]
KLVGILNVTPDSFSDGGNYLEPQTAVEHAERMLAAGAALVDMGAESTRPKATALRPDEEWARLEPVLKILLARYPGKISLDSYHPQTVRRALAMGPVLVNDVTGLNNPGMVAAVIDLKPTVIISHLPGADIQAAHKLMPVGSVEQVKTDLLAKAAVLISQGFKPEDIILDPGIGFGKTMEVNRQLLQFAEQVRDFAVMIGYSRKRFLGEQRMELAVNVEAGRVAVASGAHYLRVHDVRGHAPLLES